MNLEPEDEALPCSTHFSQADQNQKQPSDSSDGPLAMA